MKGIHVCVPFNVVICWRVIQLCIPSEHEEILVKVNSEKGEMCGEFMDSVFYGLLYEGYEVKVFLHVDEVNGGERFVCNM